MDSIIKNKRKIYVINKAMEGNNMSGAAARTGDRKEKRIRKIQIHGSGRCY